MNNTVLWVDTPVKVKHKTKHIKKHKENKLKGFFYTGFMIDRGDLPAVNLNGITNKEEVVKNTRGLGYACRKRLKYRKTKSQVYESMLKKDKDF